MNQPVMNAIGLGRDDRAEPGVDHPHHEWSPLPARPALRWPDDATMALSVVIDLSVMEWERPGTDVAVPPEGGRGVQRYPDFPRISHREYGHRAGIFRLVEALNRIEVPLTVAIDVATVEHYGPVMEFLSGFDVDYIAHGLSASRAITSLMNEDEERHYINETLERLEAGLSVRPEGWLGAEYSESFRTPALLAEAGLTYVGDWGNDDQPYPMTTPAGSLWSLPLLWDLSDLHAGHLRVVSPDKYAQGLVDAADALMTEGQTSGRFLGLHVHPWIVGQPFRIGAFERALDNIVARPACWTTTPTSVVRWVAQQR